MIATTETYDRMHTQPDLEFFKPLVSSWIGKIETSKKSKCRAHWKAQADECMHFYSLTKKLQDLIKTDQDGSFSQIKSAPKFQMVIAKAFELVAQIGPSLFFNVPDRKVTPKTLKEMPQDIFGDVENDPQAQQMFQAYEQERTTENSTCAARATLMEHWLNYTPGEMPGGGLERHAQRAITEALIKGRGVLWAEPYKKLASDRTFTGLFYDSVDNLFMDPDAEKMEDVRWMAQRVIEHYRDVEDRFDLPRNSLKKRANLESAWAEGERIHNDSAAMHQCNDTSKDMMVYYKVWSKAGVGIEYAGDESGISQRLDKVVGKHAYVVVSNSVPYPLNAPSARVRLGSSDEDVKNMFSWPIPYWADEMWPCEILDFYDQPNKIWPIPPLTPAMGELKFLSIMMSHMCNRIWMSSRSFIAVAKSAMAEVEAIIKNGDDLSVLPVSDVHGGVEKMISFLKQPDVNLDAWTIMDRVSSEFDKRSGLSDLVYGMTATQSRSAEDAAIKGQQIAVRPDYMARQVERWVSEASRKEAFCTRWFVDASDVVPLIGKVGSMLWKSLIDEQDVDAVVREMQYTIAAGSTKRRNKEVELANLNQALQFFFPEFSKHADATTDTSAINTIIQRWGDAAEMDLSEVVMGQRVPPPQEGPSPEEVEMKQEQEMHQLEMQTKSQEHQMKMVELQAKLQAEQAKVQAGLQAEQAKVQAGLQAEQAKVQIKSQADMQGMQMEQVKSQMQLAAEAQKAKGQQRTDLMGMLMDRQQHLQDLRQDESLHDQSMDLIRDKAQVELEIARKKAAVAIEVAKKTAAAKPAPQKGSNGSK